MTTAKMKVQEEGGINWTWFKVQSGNLVAVFRLHYGEETLSAFRKLEKGMTRVEKINVPMATWREKCNLIANHTNFKDGYRRPEVIKAFDWLNGMFAGTADEFETNHCHGLTMRHLEYHGVAICKVG